MNTILLFLEEYETTRLLNEWFQKSYNIIKTSSSEGLLKQFDLCIIDEPILTIHSERFRIRKKTSDVMFLLITSNSNRNTVINNFSDIIDEVINPPISKFESKIRIQSLLKLQNAQCKVHCLDQLHLGKKDLHLQMQKGKDEAVAAHDQISEIIERISDGFISVDKNWICTYANSAALKLLDHKEPKDIIGKNIWTENPEVTGTPFYSLCLEVMHTQKPASIESYFQHWKRWFESRIYPSSSGLSTFFNDTTERKRIEEELRHKQFQLSEAQRITHLGSWDTDLKTGYATWSDEMYQIFGIPRHVHNIASTDFMKLIHPDDLPEVQKWVDALSCGVNPQAIVHRFIRPDKSVRFIRSIATLILNENEKPVRIIGTAQDITESKLAEEELRYKNYLQSKSQQLARMGNWDMNLKSQEAYWSDELYRILNISKENFKPGVESFLDFVHPDDRNSVKTSLHALFSGTKTSAFDFRVLINGGTERWLRNTGEVIGYESGKPVRAVGFVQDITENKRAADTIQKSEERLRHFLEGFKGIAYQLDSSKSKMNMLFGKIEEITGYSTECFVLNMITWDQCIYLADRQRYESERNLLVQINYTADLQYRVIHRDGSVQWYREIAWSSPGISMSHPVINGIVINIHEQKLLEKRVLKLNRVYAVLSQINQIIVRIRDQQILFDKTCQIAVEYGGFLKSWIALTDQEKNIHIVAHSELGKLERYTLESGLYKSSFVDFKECYGVIKSGNPLIINNPETDECTNNAWLKSISRKCNSFAVLPLLIKNDLKAVFFLCAGESDFFDEYEVKLIKELSSDIGYAMEFIDAEIHRQKMESKLKENLVEVARKNRELRHINSALNNANMELRQFDKSKTEFVSVASHEIRTPLTSILGFTQTLLAPDLNISQLEHKKYLRIIESEARRLTKLVDDILDISKMETGRMELKIEKVFLPELVKSVIQASAIPDNLWVEYEIADGLDIATYGDRERLVQVIRNIIDNAVRFSKPGTVIKILIYRQGESVIVGVRDTGPGLPPEKQNKIFEKFYRIRGETNKSKGSGLGLAIAKEIILAHSGNIWVESEPGKGATFYFSIPATVSI